MGIIKICDRCGAANSTHLYSTMLFYYEGEKMEPLIYASDFYETDVGLLCDDCNTQYEKFKINFRNGLI